MGDDGKTLGIIVPAYNEAQNIDEVVNSWYPIVERYNGNGNSRLIVIDDGSRDDTYEILLEKEKELPLLLVHTKINGGHGSTVLYGYHLAIDMGMDYIFQTDSDGQTSPDEFELFWCSVPKYDAVLGNRTDRQDGIQRKFVERVLCLLLRIFFGVNVPDANAPFRLMKSELVKKYIGKMPKDYNLPNVMLTVFFTYYDEKVKFEPITFRSRQNGTNSINLKRILQIGWHSLKDFHGYRKELKDE